MVNPLAPLHCSLASIPNSPLYAGQFGTATLITFLPSGLRGVFYMTETTLDERKGLARLGNLATWGYANFLNEVGNEETGSFAT